MIDRVTIPDDELSVSFARSGGPGGQNVNKVNSKAVLRWRFASSNALPPRARERFRQLFRSRLTVEGEVVISSDAHRDQAQNVAACEEKLARMVREALHEDAPRRPTKPTRGSKQRRLNAKTRRGDVKATRGRVRDDD